MMNNNTYPYRDNGATVANPTDLLTNLQPATFGLRPLTFGITHLPSVFHDDIFRCAPAPFGIGQIPISKYPKPLGTQTEGNTATHLPIGNPQNPIEACCMVIVSKQKPIGMHQPPIGIIEKPIVNPRLVFLPGHLPNGNRREICTCTSKTNGSRQIPNSAKQKTIGTGQNIIVKSAKTVTQAGISDNDSYPTIPLAGNSLPTYLNLFRPMTRAATYTCNNLNLGLIHIFLTFNFLNHVKSNY